MKKLHKILLVGMLAMSVIIGNGALAKAATMNEMIDMASEEMTANYLYTKLAEKYPEYKLFFNLAESEARHTDALKKSAGRLGISIEDAEAADIEIPETLEEALEFALAYELEDIEMLGKLIEKEEDARLKRVLGNLLKGSQNHYNSLKKAIDEGIENPTCNESRAYQNRTDKQGQRGGRGQNSNGRKFQQSGNGMGN
jgi:hypothetical protein